MKTNIFDETSAFIFAVIFAASLIGSVIWKIIIEYTYISKKRPKLLTPLNIFTAGTFAAVYFLFLDFGDFRTVTDSFKNTLNVFNCLLDFNEIYEYAAKAEFPSDISQIKLFDRIFIVCLYFGLPLLTARAFFSLFKDRFTRLRYYFSFGRDCHVFSALTEKSICLATDIYNESKSHKSLIKPLIIFCNVKKDNVSDGLLLKAENINAAFYKKSVLEFKTAKLVVPGKTEKNRSDNPDNKTLAKKRNCFYLSSENDAVNEKDCVYLTQSECGSIDHIYVFSSLESSACIINAAKKASKTPVHLINEAQVIAYSLLFEHPMYESANNGMNSVLVVGAGKTGLEIAKNSIWCGSMLSLGYNLMIIDKDDKMKELEAKYGDFREAAVIAEAPVVCKSKSVNIDSDGLEEAVNEYPEATYIVVALGNDELTLSTAILLRKLYRRLSAGYSPKIIPVLKNSNYKEIASSAKESELTPFGFYESIYSYNKVIKSKIEEIAKKFNEYYNGEAKSDKSYDDLPEIERLSNLAVAVHSKYKIFDAGNSIVKKENGEYILNKKGDRQVDVEKHQRNEHNRWVRFMILNGWKNMPRAIAESRKADGEKSPQKDYCTETHACITGNSKLAALAEALGYPSDQYTKYDRIMVEKSGDCLIKTLNSKEIK